MDQRNRELAEAGARQRAAQARDAAAAAQMRQASHEAAMTRINISNENARRAQENTIAQSRARQIRGDETHRRARGDYVSPPDPAARRYDAWSFIALLAGLAVGWKVFMMSVPTHPEYPKWAVGVVSWIVGSVVFGTVNSAFIRGLTFGLLKLAMWLAVLGAILWVITQLNQYHGG